MGVDGYEMFWKQALSGFFFFLAAIQAQQQGYPRHTYYGMNSKEKQKLENSFFNPLWKTGSRSAILKLHCPLYLPLRRASLFHC